MKLIELIMSSVMMGSSVSQVGLNIDRLDSNPL